MWNTCFIGAIPASLTCLADSNSNPETSLHTIDPLPNVLATHQNPIFFFLQLGLKYPEVSLF